MRVSKGTRITLLVILLLIIDQVIKILVKTNMSIGQSIHVFGDWFQILFIENNGMAFGLQFGEGWGKLALSLCRLVLIVLIILYIRRLLKKPDVPGGVLVGMAAILCGAIGNMIDSMFYGIIFDYAPFLYGRVVDMFYFPIIDTSICFYSSGNSSPETKPVRKRWKKQAEGKGFEPLRRCRLTVFKTAAIDHSANLPNCCKVSNFFE